MSNFHFSSEKSQCLTIEDERLHTAVGYSQVKKLMNEELRSELYFLIAKFLRSQFPSFGDSFIRECEERRLFPSLVFSQTLSFEQLDKRVLVGIPDDQLIRLISLACPKSQFPSLFFSPSNTDNQISETDIILNQLGKPFSPFFGMKPLSRIVGHFDKIFCLAVDRTSRVLITGSDDFIIKIWHLPETTLIKTCNHHSNVISDIAIHPSNTIFGTSSHDHTLCLLSLQTGELLIRLEMKNEIHALRFSNCGQYLAAASEEGCVKIWKINAKNASKTEELMTVPTSSGEPAAWLSFSPGGQFLVFSADPTIVTVLSLSTKQQMQLEGHSMLPDFVFFSKKTCNKILSISTKEKSIKLWNAVVGAWESVINYSTRSTNGIKQRLLQCTWNCDETRVIAISSTYLFTWDTLNRKAISIATHPVYSDHCVVLSAHPRFAYIAFIGCISGKCALWNIERGEVVLPLRSEEGPRITEAIWSKDGGFIYVADQCGGITVYGSGTTSFTTSEMFFLSEIEEGVNDQSIIVDCNGTVKDPQPRIYQLNELSLELPVPIVIDKIKNDESNMIETWKRMEKEPGKSKASSKHETSMENSDNDETDPQSEREVVNILSQPTTKRTTRSRSVIEESLSDENESTEQEEYAEPVSKRRRNNRASSEEDTSIAESSEDENGNDDDCTTDDYSNSTNSDSDATLNRRRPPPRSYSPPSVPKRIKKPMMTRKTPTKKANEKSKIVIKKDEYSENETHSSQDYMSDDSNEEEEEYAPKNTRLNEKKKSINQRKKINDSHDESITEEEKPAKKDISKKRYVVIDDDSDEYDSTEVLSSEHESSDFEVESEKINKKPQKSSPQKTIVKKRPLSTQNTAFEDSDDTDIEEIPKSIPDWNFWDNPENNPYVPQLEEEVFYCRKGHDKYNKTEGIRQSLPNMPKSLVNQCFGTITNIEYDYNGYTIVIDAKKYGGPVFSFHYSIPNSPSFLISRSKYESSMRLLSRLEKGEHVDFHQNNEGKLETMVGIINSISANHEKEPYECINVKMEGTKRKIDISPWELIGIDERHRKSSKITKAFVSCGKTINGFVKMPFSEAFSQSISKPAKISMMLKQMIKPLSVNMIKDRCINGWYSTQEEFISDVNHLDKVAECCKINQSLSKDAINRIMKAFTDECKRNGIETSPILKENKKKK